MATSVPIDSLRSDAVFLDLLDEDNNARVRTEEVRAAIRWLLESLRDWSGIAEGNLRLELDSINTETDAGRRMLNSAEKMLREIGEHQLDGQVAAHIDIEQVREVRRLEEAQAVSEAGVVLPEAADDDESRRLLRAILDTVGGEPHPSGATGVGADQVKQFLAQTEAYLAWRAASEPGPEETVSEVLPLGESTFEAWKLYSELRDKIDQYFALDRAIRFDPRFEDREFSHQKDLSEVDISSAAAVDSLLEASALAAPRGTAELEFERRLNPLFSVQLRIFRDEVLRPLLGQDLESLSEEHWERIRRLMTPHGVWLSKKPEGHVEKLSVGRLREIIDDPLKIDAVRALIRESEITALTLASVRMVEKLVLYQAYIIPFVNNFVSFPDLYDPSKRALFDVGDLIMDGRHYNMCIQVPDRKKHVQISTKGNIFVLYLQASSVEHPDPIELAVPVTSGGRGNLYVGKQGVFQHVDGHQLDAVVVEIVENPISFSEALTSPFKRLGQILTGKIEELTTVAEKKLDSSANDAISGVGAALKKGPAVEASAAKPPVGNMLAGGSIAVAALSSSAAFVTKTLAGLEPLNTLMGLATAIAFVMMPVSIVAFLKLRQRDLSTLLEGSGWGINARMRLSRGQVRYFTHGPIYPRGARGIRRYRLLTWVVRILVATLLIAGLWFAVEQAREGQENGVETVTE